MSNRYTSTARVKKCATRIPLAFVWHAYVGSVCWHEALLAYCVMRQGLSGADVQLFQGAFLVVRVARVAS